MTELDQISLWTNTLGPAGRYLCYRSFVYGRIINTGECGAATILTICQDWYEVFDDAVKVVFFDHLKESPLLLMRDICAWLEIDASVYDKTLEWSVENKTVSYKNRILHRLAIQTNKNSERFLRAHPRFKKCIKDMYYFVNGHRHKEDFRGRHH